MTPRFQVSDKVRLAMMGPLTAKPRLVRGRVYCVAEVREQNGQQFVGLVGVECRKLRPDRRARDPQGTVVLLHSLYFDPVGRLSQQQG